MKKVTINLILSLAIAAALLVFVLVFGTFLGVLGSGLGDLSQDINVIFDDGEVDTVEGHGAIVQGAFLVVGALAGAVILVMIVLVGGYSLLLILFAVVARVVFATQGGRLLAYRILMGIEYVLQAGIVWLCVDVMLEDSGALPVILFVFGAAVTGSIVYSAVNTYSKRICE